MIYRFFLIACFCIGVMFVPQPVQAGKLMDFFFPSLRDTGPNPSETLKAPFAGDDVVAANAENVSSADVVNTVPLHLPHRASEMIADWVTASVAESLSFQDEDYNVDLQRTAQHFNGDGRAEYETFLDEKKIKNVLQSSQYRVHSYVSSPPLLLNEGAVQKRYRWLYQVPVMVSYIKGDVKDYKGVEPTNQHLVVRVQVGRSKDVRNDLGLQIERWSGDVKKQGKK